MANPQIYDTVFRDYFNSPPRLLSLCNALLRTSYEDPGDVRINTLDGAYCDFCVSQVAAVLGRKQLQQQYLDRSKNYRNLFEPATGFLRGRLENGAFPAAFSPIRWGGEYCEGAAWQNGFNVPHDLEGLSALYGIGVAVRGVEARQERFQISIPVGEEEELT